jgi:dTDP-glucose 4,6-dehydratase
MTRMLIHGAGGFVGGAFIDSLSKADADELILTDIRPVAHWVKRNAWPMEVKITAVQTGRLCGTDLPGVDVVVALAGQTNVDEGLRDPHKSFTTNVDIAADVAWWSFQHPGTRLIYLSSDETLGASFVALSEQARLAPTQPYAASKSAAETIIKCYRDTYGVDFIIVRSCNLVGMQLGVHKLIPTAVECLRSGRPVPVHGDGNYIREWLAVEDLCAALRLIALPGLDRAVYHCSSGIHLTVTEIIKLVAEGLGVPPKWRHVTDRLVNDRCYSMDSSRLRAQGWSPKYDVREAIRAAAKRLAVH